MQFLACCFILMYAFSQMINNSQLRICTMPACAGASMRREFCSCKDKIQYCCYVFHIYGAFVCDYHNFTGDFIQYTYKTTMNTQLFLYSIVEYLLNLCTQLLNKPMHSIKPATYVVAHIFISYVRTCIDCYNKGLGVQIHIRDKNTISSM